MKKNKRSLTFTIISAAFALTLTIAICAFCGKEAPSAATDDENNTTSETASQTIYAEPLKATTVPVAEIPAATEPPTWEPDEKDVELIAKTLYGECRGVKSTTEKAAVAWCILNRVDTKGYACGHSVEYVVTFKNQFQGYDPSHPVTPELKDIARDVLIRHHDELTGGTNVGRVLPREYIYFIGDTKRNYFTTEFLGKDYWDWSLETPYDN